MLKPTHQKQLIAQRLDKAVETWLSDCRYENRSPRTESFYGEFIAPFVQFIGGHVLVHEITPDHIRKYFDKPNTEYVHSARYRVVRVFFNWSKRQSYLFDTPLVIRAPKVVDRVKELFSKEDYERMLRACSGRCMLRDKAILMLFWDTGMRPSEMARSQLSWVSLDAKMVKVLGKGNKERLIPIRGETIRALWAYIKTRQDNDAGLFLSNKGWQLTIRGIHIMVRKLMRKAGIKYKASPDTFRHTLTDRLLSADPPLSPLEVQYILGHRTLSMVQRYARRREAQRAIEAMRRVQG